MRWLFVLVLLPSSTFAATHWISTTGTAAWASCVGSSPITGTSACSFATANTNAVAGDVINFDAGTYNSTGDIPCTVAGPNSGSVINPTHSGSAGPPISFITYQAAPSASVTITQSSFPNRSMGFCLDAVSYIRITGFTFHDLWGEYIIGFANHNEVDNNTFLNDFTTAVFGAGQTTSINFEIMSDDGSSWATHNWIHNNSFTTTGKSVGASGLGCTDGGWDTMDVGRAFGTFVGSNVDNDNNNTIENNVFSHSPHAAIENYGLYTVFRNNYVHNEPWSPGCASHTNSSTYSSSNPNYSAYNGMFGHRNAEFDDEYDRLADYDLLESNRFGFAGVNDANDGADGMTLGTIQAIYRYNFNYAAMNPNLIFKWGCGTAAGGPNGKGGDGGCFNRVYNNTFYQGGYGYPAGLTCGLSTCPWDETNIATYDGAFNNGNVLKNNILYLSAGFAKSPQGTQWGFDVADKGGPSNAWSIMAAGTQNNWCSGTQNGGSLVAGGATSGCSTSGNPMFNNPDLSNPASTILPDLSLQSGSTAIDGGTWLTTSTNSGSTSTSLTVADALYFQDGTWGSDLSRPSAGLGGTMQADWICIQTIANCVQISAISYGAYNAPAGTITLASPMTWANSSHVWLFKKSDGTQVLYGAAPDFGASEFNGNSGVPAVPALILTIN